MIKRTFIIIFITITSIYFAFTSFADTPYDNYIYSVQGQSVAEPQAYVPSRIITGESLGLSNFNEPQDIIVDDKNEIFIVDSGNNRIIYLNADLSVKKIITDININGNITKLNNPQSIYVDKNMVLYIADTDNKRIVKYNLKDDTAIELKKPVITMLGANYDYIPEKIAVDSAGRIFLVAKGVSNGMIELNSDGSFDCFFGAINTTPSISDIFWRRFMTKEQLSRQQSQIPTEYNNVNIDSNDFVYGTISSFDSKIMLSTMTFGNSGNSIAAIKKLNPLGTDILRRLGSYPPNGDVEVLDAQSTAPKVSKIIDVAFMDNGIYSLLDAQKGRIFTYDNDGNLLYTFGGIGTQIGLFNLPEAFDIDCNNKYYIVDSGYDQVVEFIPTAYAEKVLKATSCNFKMEYNQSEKAWVEVMKYSTNSDIGYIGLGNALMRQGKYEEAMKFFKLGNNKSYYSLAFAYFRSIVIKNCFAISISILILLILSIYIVKIFIKRKGIKNDR
jgi:hypothetical protein